MKVIADDGEQTGWEHVSVSFADSGVMACPTWEDMCLVKSLFWDDEDCVVQFHPPKSEYVNVHEGVLHLWKQRGVQLATPPRFLV